MPTLKVKGQNDIRTIIYYIYISQYRLNRPESVLLASLARQLLANIKDQCKRKRHGKHIFLRKTGELVQCIRCTKN